MSNDVQTVRSTYTAAKSSGLQHVTPREMRWLKHIERHGPQSSVYLFELSRDTHRSKDTALRQMQKLRGNGLLRLPKQQRATEHAEFNPYIYDLTPLAETVLFDHSVDKASVRPHGHWVHQYMTSCVTSSIDITAIRHGFRYIPAQKILALQNSTLSVPIRGQKLIPDQLFALDYGRQFRAFALEVDRGTEPKTSSAMRKSYLRSIQLYRHLIEAKLHQSHYGLKANLLILWVFSRRTNQMRFLELVEEHADAASNNFYTQTIFGFDQVWRPPDLLAELITEDWQGANGATLNLSVV